MKNTDAFQILLVVALCLLLSPPAHSKQFPPDLRSGEGDITKFSQQKINEWRSGFYDGSNSKKSTAQTSFSQFRKLELEFMKKQNWEELERLYETTGRQIYKNNPEVIDLRVAELLYRRGRYREAKAVIYKHITKIKKDSVKFKKDQEKARKRRNILGKKGFSPRFRCANPAIEMKRRISLVQKLEQKCPRLYPWQANKILKERDLKFGRVRE